MIYQFDQSAGISDTVMFDADKSLHKNCIICFKYKKPKSMSVVGFTLALDFNETVAMD